MLARLLVFLLDTPLHKVHISALTQSPTNFAHLDMWSLLRTNSHSLLETQHHHLFLTLLLMCKFHYPHQYPHPHLQQLRRLPLILHHLPRISIRWSLVLETIFSNQIRGMVCLRFSILILNLTQSLRHSLMLDGVMLCLLNLLHCSIMAPGILSLLILLIMWLGVNGCFA